MDKRHCANKDVEPRRGLIGGSHIDWRRERVPARMLGPEWGWIVRSHIGWGVERSIIYKGVKTSPSISVLKTSPSISVLKTLRRNLKKTISTSGGLGYFHKY